MHTWLLSFFCTWRCGAIQRTGPHAALAFSVPQGHSGTWLGEEQGGVALWLDRGLAGVVGAGVAWVGGKRERKEFSIGFPLMSWV